SELEKAARLDPHPQVLRALAEAYFQAGQLAHAEGVVERLLTQETGKDQVPLYYLSAEMKEPRGDEPGAIEIYRKTLAIDRSEENAWLSLSRLYIRSQDIDRAVASLKDLLKIYPDSERGHYYVASLYRRQGRLREARFHFEKAVAQNPEMIQALR